MHIPRHSKNHPPTEVHRNTIIESAHKKFASYKNREPLSRREAWAVTVLVMGSVASAALLSSEEPRNDTDRPVEPEIQDRTP